MSTTFDPVEAFSAAGGSEADGTWAGAAFLRLTMANLAQDEVRARLDDALALVRESQVPADELFGDPIAWADGQLEQASVDGAAFTDDDATPGDVIAVGLGMAGLMAMLCFVLCVVKWRWTIDWSLGLALMPALLSVLTVSAITAREALVHRMASAAAAIVTAIAITPVIVLAGWALWSAPSLGRHSSLWWLAQAAGWFFLAWASARLIPDSAPRVVRTGALDDEQWLQEARVKLRERGEFTEGQLEGILDEARAHAAASGARLADEFGNPIGYVRSLPGDAMVRHGRSGALWLAMTALWLYLGLADGWHHPSWWRLAFAAVCLVMATRELRARAQARERRSGNR